MPKSFLVVGGGLQGLVAAQALRRGKGRPDVAVVDARPPPAVAGIKWYRFDALASDGRLESQAQRADACVVALPGDVAERAVSKLARAGACVADMSFVPEPSNAAMDASARKSGAIVVRDVGVAPGLSHLLAAALCRELGGLDELNIFVGGLPRKPPANAFRHAVYFNAMDLISEYTRPARLRRRGRDLQLNPLSKRHELDVRDGHLGRLEAFPSDGLRTLLTSFPECPVMGEYTLRWPGHLKEMRRLDREGLLVSHRGGKGPALLTAAALDRAYPGRQAPDVLLMEVHAKRGRRRTGWRLLDRRRGRESAMSRTTAFTAAAVARALSDGRVKGPGLHAPEVLGAEPETFGAVLADLRAQGIRVVQRTQLRARP